MQELFSTLNYQKIKLTDYHNGIFSICFNLDHGCLRHDHNYCYLNNNGTSQKVDFCLGSAAGQTHKLYALYSILGRSFLGDALLASFPEGRG